MAAVKYSSWTLARLKAEQRKIEKAIEAKESKDRNKAITAVKQAARKSGFAISDLLDELGGKSDKPRRATKKASGRKKTGKVPPEKLRKSRTIVRASSTSKRM